MLLKFLFQKSLCYKYRKAADYGCGEETCAEVGNNHTQHQSYGSGKGIPRCLYYGGDLSLHDVWQRYQLSSGRFGRQSRQASKAWTQYQMMTTAVWSTGDGSKRKPLYVRSREDAEVAIMGYDTALWFKMKGKRKFSVAPRQ